ncbi:hypothetical protein P692DRAFT_20828180 [Suillus brevipes Sb2]|nr:hypothetical protein P692DRAFT_20828180 [Suillus brevipes Sb2]
MQSVDSTTNVIPASYIINALHHILRARVFMSNLDTPYSQAILPNSDHPTIELNSKSISTIITTRQQQLDAVLREISGLEMVMDNMDILHQQLVERTEEIIQSMAFHKGLGSALWRLPPEILSLIFHHCLIPDGLLMIPRLPEPYLAPVLLTRICRSWRDVAVNTPSLWCKLHVEIYLSGAEEELKEDMEFYNDDWEGGEEEEAEVDDRAWQQIAFFYDSWLKRSRGRPLSLVLRHFPSTKLLRNLLQPYMHQISSLHFIQGAKRPQLLLEGLSTLRELVIYPAAKSSNDLDLTQNILKLTRSISQLPSTMRVLEVGRSPLNIHHVSSLNPVLTHLTHVRITLRHVNALLQLLRLCPNLSSLKIDLDFFEKDETSEPVTHANIRSFRVVSRWSMSASSESLADMLDALSLPNLRIFECYCREGVWPHKQLRDLFVRSKCPLESLIFTGGVTAEAVSQAEYVALIPSPNIVVSSNRLFY